MSSPVWGVPGPIYSLWRENRGGGRWIGLDFQFLIGMELKSLTIGSKVMSLGSLRCINRCVILFFMISHLFQLQFRPMNSHWKKNWIIFAMALPLTRFGSWIKIRVLGTLGIDFESNLAKIVLKIFKKLGFDVKLWKTLFYKSGPRFGLRLNLG